MPTSKKSIKAISPAVFAGESSVKAFFTLKNEQDFADNGKIDGLNLGFNTDEFPEIVAQNRKALLQFFDIASEWVAFANQVHGNHVKVVTAGGTFTGTDALVTQIPALALAIQVADCGAILLADSASRTIGAVHAGWRGAVGDILPKTVRKMTDLGASVSNLKAFISPCISKKSFEVGPEVATQFPGAFVDAENYKKPHVDLKGFLRHQLQQVGLITANIEVHPGCTMLDHDYYSYRRELQQSGRMMAVIQLKA